MKYYIQEAPNLTPLTNNVTMGPWTTIDIINTDDFLRTLKSYHFRGGSCVRRATPDPEAL